MIVCLYALQSTQLNIYAAMGPRVVNYKCIDGGFSPRSTPFDSRSVSSSTSVSSPSAVPPPPPAASPAPAPARAPAPAPAPVAAPAPSSAPAASSPAPAATAAALAAVVADAKAIACVKPNADVNSFIVSVGSLVSEKNSIATGDPSMFQSLVC